MIDESNNNNENLVVESEHENVIKKDAELIEIDGIGPKIVTLLQKNLIITVKDLALSDPEKLGLIRGISYEEGSALILAAQMLLRKKGILPNEFINISEAIERRNKVLRLKTGSEALDNFLKGGIETSAMTEFYGEFGSGKSQICHMLTINSTLPLEEKGFNAAVIYIDTEGTFRPERVVEMCKERDIDINTLEGKVKLCRVYNSAHLETIIDEIHIKIEELNAKLIIIDSLINLHRAEFAGRATLNERQIRINKMIKKMIKTAEIYNVAFVITNQVTANPDGGYGADPQKPVGGNIIGHASTYRIYLRRSGPNRVAKMIDSPYHEYGETLFSINKGGITEAIKK